ncbi:PIN domain-containing protein [Epidermidibacterium keratini]|uniref:Ribonuclease VapC n=1 Tax=Epidermidibacterium keratini TaxID=1891644 RepID=A0A7L4YRQ8_9ACTN|nr:type II toxin-antitoxin system VapC family toxin [Epidermidibacterium keratini]QHC01653.1 PIN domain-containing protein [Epidermidibacterium keratini]
MIVLDASAAVEWLLGRPAAGSIAARLADPDTAIHAPSLVGVEVTSALRGLVLARHATAERASAALSDLMGLDISLHDPTPLLPRVWALRDNLTVYDAVYVALAEILDATLLTTDARIARAMRPDAAVDVLVAR